VALVPEPANVLMTPVVRLTARMRLLPLQMGACRQREQVSDTTAGQHHSAVNKTPVNKTTRERLQQTVAQA
jgi:hypothetical protein